jgi:hypothetical protein
MKKRKLAFMAFLSLGLIFMSCGGGSPSKKETGTPEITSMKCEFVPDGSEAVIYGKNLKNTEVIFPGNLTAVVNTEKSNDSTLVVAVPEGTTSGKISVKNAKGEEVKSTFFFRDNRNIIINFDNKLPTWGGYTPFYQGEKMTRTDINDESTALPAELPDSCSGLYGFLYGKYNTAWTMSETMYIQYVANPDEGGRGPVSIAGSFETYDIEDLALKFEVYIPKEVPYQGVKTEIFFGPYNSPDKHGRSESPICFWEPYQKSGSFYTDGWETITIPLTEFYHGVNTDEEVVNKIDLKKATNFSFVQFGAPENEPLIYMCVDNFRVVPTKN